MTADREGFEQRLLKGYRAYYDVEEMAPERRPLLATAFFHVHSAKYVLMKSAEIWAADCNEYIYVFSAPRLTAELYEQCLKLACDDGIPRVEPGKDHMASYIGAVFLCDDWDAEAVRALKKCRIRKSFHFSLHGWMEVHTAAVNLGKGTIAANYPSSETAKYLKNLLHGRRRSKSKLKMFLEILKD